jgi:acyl-CoA synthetase (AMP-forming)/AMP-acid ligase II
VIVEITEDELVAWAKDQMASYKYPRVIEFRDELPMTATGKVEKYRLRAQGVPEGTFDARAHREKEPLK